MTGDQLMEEKNLGSMSPPYCQVESGAQRAMGMKLGWEKHRVEFAQGWELVEIRA